MIAPDDTSLGSEAQRAGPKIIMQPPVIEGVLHVDRWLRLHLQALVRFTPPSYSRSSHVKSPRLIILSIEKPECVPQLGLSTRGQAGKEGLSASRRPRDPSWRLPCESDRHHDFWFV